MAIGDLMAGPETGFVDLVEGFPTGRGQGGGDYLEPVVAGIFRCAQKPESEAFEAAASSLRFVFQAFHAVQPCLMVIVCIHYLQSEGFGIAGAFVLADFIFLAWIDVRIAVIYDRCDPMLHQTLYYGA